MPVTEAGKLEPFHASGQAWKGNCDMATDITDLFAVNPHAAYYIKGIVNSYPVKFMLDTGAAVSLLDVNVWNTIKGKPYCLLGIAQGWLG